MSQNNATNRMILRWEADGLHTEFVPINDAPDSPRSDGEQQAAAPSPEPRQRPRHELVRREIGSTGLRSVIPYHVFGD